MMSKRFIYTLLTLLVIGAATGAAVFFAKGFRLSPDKGVITGTGILSITSKPDQASVYLDGHLSTATNTNINSLLPKEYSVKIIKEGFIPWEKKVEVKEGLVTEVEATLFRAIPTVYPLTYSGALNPQLSPDGLKVVYVVPVVENADSISRKKSGVWVWEMSERPLTLARNSEPHQIALFENYDWTKAEFTWSPDSSHILASFPEQHLLLDVKRLNDPPQDVTLTLQVTQRTWQQVKNDQDATRMLLIKDLSLRKTASDSAVLKWAPDESKILYSADGKENYKVTDVALQRTYDIPFKGILDWLPDSQHLILVETGDQATNLPNQSKTATTSAKASPTVSHEPKPAKISIVEYDGFNKAEIFAGNFDPYSVFAWPDYSRLVVIYSLPTATASEPNLYGINLK